MCRLLTFPDHIYPACISHAETLFGSTLNHTIESGIEKCRHTQTIFTQIYKEIQTQTDSHTHRHSNKHTETDNHVITVSHIDRKNLTYKNRPIQRHPHKYLLRTENRSSRKVSRVFFGKSIQRAPQKRQL